MSEVGFGAWAIGGGAMIGDTAIGWGEVDDEEAGAALHAALDAGITFFDTADIYGLGHSETLLGKHIGSRTDVVIATKVGNVARDGKFTIDYSPAHIRQACEGSLRRLKRGHIDYYQLHTARMEHLINGECLLALQQLQQEGKVRHWGLSLNTFAPLEEAQWMMQHGSGQGFQLVFNIINQRALPLLSEARHRGYGLIARMPLQFGLLTGKFDAATRFAANDHRKNRLTVNVIDSTREALQPIGQLCSKYDCTPAQLALSYVLSYPEVSVVIPGMRNRSQVAENTTGLFRLEPDDRAFIEQKGQEEFTGLMDLFYSLG